jgi:hypothetical protein
MKSETELPVAVRVVDRHGLVVVLRITPAGNAFFRGNMLSKGRLRAQVQRWPVEMRDDAKDIRRSKRVFLDEVPPIETFPVYCSKGRHQVDIPINELRQRAEAFKAGERTTTLDVS